MSTVGVIGKDTVNSCSSVPNSPKNKLKFFCSHGGKILSWPADGHLKYIGGETRVISTPRDIGSQELMTIWLRASLFPANPTAIENQMASTEREFGLRYIDAINGIISAAPRSTKPRPTIIVGRRGTFISSACSSPRSPESCTSTTEAMRQERPIRSRQLTGRVEMQRVKSSPSTCNLNILKQSYIILRAWYSTMT